MPRHLDLAALRALVTAADVGGVTRASAQLNLTQSAVSMQLKRLEAALGQPLLDRTGRGIALTGQGELLVGYGRRLLALNDEVWGRMTAQEFEGEVHFGVPQDIIYPHVPSVLQCFAADYPRVRVVLHSSFTAELKEQMGRGEIDLILTTEAGLDAGGETLVREPLVWIGAPGGQAWRARPVRFATMSRCLYRKPAVDALDRAGLEWRIAADSISMAAVEASVSADLAIHVQLESAISAQFERIRHGGALPALPDFVINMYAAGGPRAALAARLAEAVRCAYGRSERVAAE
ncbi:LysR family transcriptional regulator [soil metagenome]